MDNIVLLHLVDGTEILARVHGRMDAQVGITDPWAVSFQEIPTEDGQKAVTWKFRPLHPLQNYARGFNFMPQVNSNSILYSVPALQLPPQLVENYLGLVQQEQQAVQQLAAQQELARKMLAEATAQADDGPTDTQA